MEKIRFNFGEQEETAEFFVLEQTRVGGKDYILVTDSEEGDAEALILKDMSSDGEKEAIYEIVVDDNELEAVSRVFSEMLEDIDLI